MVSGWISLARSWSLQDVQAVLTVVISLLSGLTIWSGSRACWQHATTPLIKGQSVPVHSIFSISSPGDVYDVLQLFRKRVITPKRVPRLLLQSVVITIFSLCAMLSGPIARSVSRIGVEVTQTAHIGRMAITQYEQGQEKIKSALVRWNETLQSLQDADFPQDQLLDYLPDPSLTWLYRADEWNSSWAMQCNFTQRTPIDLIASGNRSDYSLYTQMPGLADALPDARFLNTTNYLGRTSICGFEGDRSFYRDIYLFTMRYPSISSVANYNIAKRGDDNDYAAIADSRNPSQAMSFSITAFHMHRAPRRSDMDGDAVTFGTGPVGRAAYTRTDCDLQLSQSPPENVTYAYPDILDPDSVVDAFGDFYRPTVVERSLAGAEIDPPSPQELVRFYQVYMVTKDTQHQHPVQRMVTTQLPVVQVSSIFVSVIVLQALLIVLATGWHLICRLWTRSDIASQVPDTKTDWLLLAVRESRGPAFVGSRDAGRRCLLDAVTYGPYQFTMQPSGQMKIHFRDFGRECGGDRSMSESMLQTDGRPGETDQDALRFKQQAAVVQQHFL